MADSKKKVCVVVGVGPGNGAAFARRFAKEGYALALLARSEETSAALVKELPDARAYACDVTDAASIEKTFASIAKDLGAPEVVVYNAGTGVWGTVEEIDASAFENAFRVNALGLLLVSKAVIPAMTARGSGSIVVIGATASRRGMPKTAAFAPAKAAQRSLCESMARTLWPKKIHVSLVIVDGVIDTPRGRSYAPKDLVLLAPDDIAEVVLGLTKQQQTAWSFEVEARPFSEKW